jgi:hypothetical protein
MKPALTSTSPVPSPSRRAWLRGAVALAVASGTPLALAHVAPHPSINISVIDRHTGQTLPTYWHEGRLWVAGRPGARYAVRVANTGARRTLAVMSVDGINVITGQTASPTQSGYVLEAGGQYDIAGWRKSLGEIAAFEFTALPRSYAARTGRPGDVGVIGVAVFAEALPPPPPPPVWREPQPMHDHPSNRAPQAPSSEMRREHGEAAGASASAPDAAPSAVTRSAPRAAEKIGTGHGQREVSHTSTTQFVRATREPQQVLSLHYDSYDNLVAMGIIPRPAHPHGHHGHPRPFPADPTAGFTPDPPRGWR